jgi:predicted nucleotidyltransferase
VVARPSRLDIEGGWYHVLNRGQEKRRIFPDEKANQHFSRIAWHPTGPFWASNWRRYIEGREIVSQKKYLYVFRPILACRWIERDLGQPPILFSELIRTVLEESEVCLELDQLINRKRAGTELGEDPQNSVFDRFLTAEIARLESVVQPEEREVNAEALNEFFRRTLRG